MDATEVVPLRREMVTRLDHWLASNPYRSHLNRTEKTRINFAKQLFTICQSTDTAYWVSDEMGSVARAASAELPFGGVLLPDQFPALQGLLLYQNPPTTLVDLEVPFSGFAWNTTTDYGEPRVRLLILAPGANSPVAVRMVFPPFAQDFSDEDRRLLKLIHATLLMMQQPIAEVEPAHVRRSEQRRCQREGVVSDLVTMKLRRKEVEKHRPEGVSEREWSHRWLVSGHWRQQPYGPGRKQRRQRWIPGYVKGPQDKPLVVKEHLTTWAR